MAVVHSILGYINGKAQNTVFAQQKGQTTLRAYQPNVSNPSTEKQRSNRDVLAWILILANYLNFPVLVPFLTPKKRKQSAINSFTSQLGKIITAIASENSVIRYEVISTYLGEFYTSNLSVSNGPKSINLTDYTTVSVTTAQSTTAETDGWTWTTTNLSPKDQSTDNLRFVAVNISTPKEPAITNTTRTRADGTATVEFTLPTRAASDVILVFAFFGNDNDGETSKGLVYGKIVGTTWTKTTTRQFIG